MSKHFRLPYDWKFKSDWDMSYADALRKLGWEIKNHV